MNNPPRRQLVCTACAADRVADRDYPCLYCGGRSFTTAGRLHRHLRRIHPKTTRQLSCTEP